MKRDDRVRHPIHGEGRVLGSSALGGLATVRWGGTLPGQSYIRTHVIADLTLIEKEEA